MPRERILSADSLHEADPLGRTPREALAKLRDDELALRPRHMLHVGARSIGWSVRY